MWWAVCAVRLILTTMVIMTQTEVLLLEWMYLNVCLLEPVSDSSSFPLPLPLLHLGWLCQCLGLLPLWWVPGGRSREGAQVWAVVVWQGSQEQAGCHGNETDNGKWLKPDILACFAVHWHRVWVNRFEHCNFMHVSYLPSDWQTLKVLILTHSQLNPPQCFRWRMPYQYLLHVSCLDIPLLAVTGMRPWS